MGQYAIYIWPCYCLVFLLFGMQAISTWLEWRKIRRQASSRYRTPRGLVSDTKNWVKAPPVGST